MSDDGWMAWHRAEMQKQQRHSLLMFAIGWLGGAGAVAAFFLAP